MTHALFQRFVAPQDQGMTDVTVRDWPVGHFTQHVVAPQATNVALLPAPGTVNLVCGAFTLAVGPGRYWVVAPDFVVQAQILGDADRCTDLLGSRQFWQVQGRHAADLLARMAPMDFALRRFGHGRVVDTVAEGVPLTIWRMADIDCFYIAIPASYAAFFIRRLQECNVRIAAG
jgi:heterotetrameric sarcosine oxidase gamma subunit